MKGHAGRVGSRQGGQSTPQRFPALPTVYPGSASLSDTCVTPTEGAQRGGTMEAGHELERPIKQGRPGVTATIKCVSISCSSPGPNSYVDPSQRRCRRE